MSKEKQSEEKKPSAITRRDFLKGIAVGAVVTGAVATGVAAVSWPAAPPAPPGAVTKTETVTRTTTAPATTITTTATAPPVTTTVTAPAVTTTLPAVTTTVTTTAVPPPPEVKPAYTKTITLNVNGKDYTLEVENRRTLVDVLREVLNLPGTKIGCNRGECGACTVLVDGKRTLSCTTLAVEAGGKKILTIEGLAKDGVLHPIQKAFIERFGFQCAFCTPGMIMSSKALLDKNPSPTKQQVKEALAGNLCRCHDYAHILDSVMSAAKTMRGG